MSTDRKKKNRGFARVERIKIIEYACIGLVILLFLGLAILYGSGGVQKGDRSANASPSPVPTADTSIRGKNVLDALLDAGFAVEYGTDQYDVRSESGVFFAMRMISNDKGILELSFETALCPDPEEDTLTARYLIDENRKTIDALQTLFDRIMPVFHRPASDSDTIVKQCLKVVNNGETYSKHLGKYSVRIQSDPEAIPQTVSIDLIRD